MSKRIIRLEPNGPGGCGLSPLEIDRAAFFTPPARQNAHVAFSDPALGVNVGVWDTTTMQEAFGPYPGDEFIILLEGAFALIDGEGRGHLAESGQCVAIRNGVPVSWMQAGYLRKIFMTLHAPGAGAPALETAKGGVFTLDPGATLGDEDHVTYSDSGAKQRERVIFSNDAGTMEGGLWDTEALTTEPYPFPCHELALVLEGEVTIEDGAGGSETFRSGDAFFIPEGTITRWLVPRYLRKYYATISRSA